MLRQADDILDEYLVLAAQDGSREAFRRLVIRWTPRLRRHAARVLLDAEAAGDVVQDVWLAVTRGLKRLGDPSRFGGWAFAITSRRCADEIRRRRQTRALVTAAAQVDTDGSGARVDADGSLDLAAALSRLPPDQRLLVSLFYGEGLGVDELARAFAVPPGTIKSRLYAARNTLKVHLEGVDHVED